MQRIGRMAVGLGFALCVSATALAKAPVVGQAAPDFKLTTLDGKVVRLSDLRGQVVVVNIWATWCAPCKRELPLLDAYFRLQQTHGLQVFALTTEDSVPLYQLRPLAKFMAIPIVRAMHGPYDQMEGVPTNFVIDRAGVLRYAKAGAFDLNTLNTILVPLLREPAPDPAPPATVTASPTS